MPTATLAPTSSAPSRTAAPAAPPLRATDDEILGITSSRKTPPRNTQQLEFDFDAAATSTTRCHPERGPMCGPTGTCS